MPGARCGEHDHNHVAPACKLKLHSKVRIWLLHVCTLPITVAGVILDIYGFVIKVRNVFSTKIILYKTTKTVVVTTVVEQ